MPVVTLTEDNETRYYAVTDGNECDTEALVQEFKLSESNSREYVEHELQKEYLRRLTEHAYDCAQLAHLVRNPTDDETQIGHLGLLERLADKIAENAIWLRTYDPFTGLTAEAVRGGERAATGLQIVTGSPFDAEHETETVSTLGNDSWGATEHALRIRSPWYRDEALRRQKAKAAEYTPTEEKRIAEAAKALRTAIGRASKRKKRSEQAVANKTLRRSKRRAK